LLLILVTFSFVASQEICPAIIHKPCWLSPLLVVLLLKWYYNSNMEQNKDRKIISTNTRYPVELRESLLRLAKKHKRSFNAEVMWALHMYVEQQEAKGKS